MVGCDWRLILPNHQVDRPVSVTTLPPLLRILRWVVLALTLSWVSVAAAQDQRPLDLEATRNALTGIENALKQPNLADADLLRLRAENDPLGVALQAAIAELTPRLASSVKRLAELTPKTKDKDATPPTDAATAELETEKQKHDALDANLRAARAMLLEVDDISTRIGARRRDLFARQTFARTSSVFNPQLWLSVSREIPSDARAVSEGRRRLDFRRRGPHHPRAGARHRRRSCSARAGRDSAFAGSRGASSIAIPTPDRRAGCSARWRRPGSCSCSPSCRFWGCGCCRSGSTPSTSATRACRG